MNKSRKLLIVEDCSLTALGIKHILSKSGEIDAIDIVSSWEHAERKISNVSPQTILISNSVLPVSAMTLLSNVRQRYPHIKMILIGNDCNGLCLQRVVKAGINGFILKYELSDVILVALQIINQGGYYFCSASIDTSSCPIDPTLSSENVTTLTIREKQVFELAISGLDATQIAFTLSYQHKRYGII
mgnify:CR=1 FL=1